jgi:hypothetical protein
VCSAVGWLAGTVVAVALVFILPVNEPAVGMLLGMVCAGAGGAIGWAVGACRG